MGEQQLVSELRYGLPKRYYTAPEVFAAEIERIFCRTWQFAGLLEHLAKPGDYFATTAAGQDVLVLRGGDGTLRGFYNVCRHRAHRLLEGAGKVRRIVCPYHAWSYDLDGRLVHARNSENVAGFDDLDICLTPVRVETFCNLVFVNLDPDAEPLRRQTENLEDEIRGIAPNVEAVRLADRVEKEIEANWKVVIENFSECYHCAVAHPSFTKGVVDPASYRITPHRYYQRHSSAAQPEDRFAYEYDHGASAHADTFYSWYIWPAVAFQVYPGGGVNAFVWQPLSATRTRVVHDWYFPDVPATAAQKELVRQHRETTFAEDFPLVESVQRGLASRGYERGPLMIDRDGSELSEQGVFAIQQLVLEALERDEESGEPAFRSSPVLKDQERSRF